jgi:hypothetical protein
MSWLNANGVEMKAFEIAEMKASQVLTGIPPGDMADRMEAFETHLQEWIDAGNRNWVWRMLRKVGSAIMADILKIRSSEVYELAVGYAKQMNDSRAAVMQANDHAQLRLQIAQQRALRSFLFEHFSTDLANAESLNLPLTDLACQILLRYKYPNNATRAVHSSVADAVGGSN